MASNSASSSGEARLRLPCRPHASAARARRQRSAGGGRLRGPGQAPVRSVSSARCAIEAAGEAIGFGVDAITSSAIRRATVSLSSSVPAFTSSRTSRFALAERCRRSRRSGSWRAGARSAAGRDASMALSARPASPASFVSRMICQSCCSSSAIVRLSAATRSAAAGVVVAPLMARAAGVPSPGRSSAASPVSWPRRGRGFVRHHQPDGLQLEQRHAFVALAQHVEARDGGFVQRPFGRQRRVDARGQLARAQQRVVGQKVVGRASRDADAGDADGVGVSDRLLNGVQRVAGFGAAAVCASGSRQPGRSRSRSDRSRRRAPPPQTEAARSEVARRRCRHRPAAQRVAALAVLVAPRPRRWPPSRVGSGSAADRK